MLCFPYYLLLILVLSLSSVNRCLLSNVLDTHSTLLLPTVHSLGSRNWFVVMWSSLELETRVSSRLWSYRFYLARFSLYIVFRGSLYSFCICKTFVLSFWLDAWLPTDVRSWDGSLCYISDYCPFYSPCYKLYVSCFWFLLGSPLLMAQS